MNRLVWLKKENSFRKGMGCGRGKITKDTDF